MQVISFFGSQIIATPWVNGAAESTPGFGYEHMNGHNAFAGWVGL